MNDPRPERVKVASIASVLVLASLVATPLFAKRLPTAVAPDHYDLTFTVDLAKERFDGSATIRVRVNEPTSRIVLNAVDLDVEDATVAAGAATQKAVVSFNAGDEVATLTIARPLAKGSAEIRIRFRGGLSSQLRGFYVSRGGNRKVAVTQFESTDARRAFPCFDEPALKATFALTLIVDRGDTAITNGRLLSDTPGPGTTRHTLRFASSPKMSSYLVAMAVGDFRCLEGGQDQVPIRICATPDKRSLGRIALESAAEILKFYNSYFTVKYPFGKLDIVAVPDFAAGGMENTAAIFFRETDLLADDRSASPSTRKAIASGLAHEMAHLWFGDLVTMRWWDDLWLNEGFATWMATHPLAAWKPEWNVAVDEAAEIQKTLNLDSLPSVHPLHARVETPAEIEASFDAITYQKGAAVLRMIEHYVGADTFRKGVNRYLQAHAYGNANAQDFWTAMAAASGLPVDRIMPTFINQPGVPLINVSATCTSGLTKLALTQERFFLDPTLLNRGSRERWQVPVCSKRPDRPDQNNASCAVVSDLTTTITAGAGAGGCAPWVFANAGARGYYRTAYQPAALRAMAPRLQDRLTAAERLSLVEDEWALVRAGRHTITDYLTIAAGFGNERTSGVLALVTPRLGFIDEHLTTDATRPQLQAFIRSLFRPSFDELGVDRKAGDSEDRRSLRAVIVSALGTTGADAEVISWARSAVDRALGARPGHAPAARGESLHGLRGTEKSATEAPRRKETLTNLCASESLWPNGSVSRRPRDFCHGLPGAPSRALRARCLHEFQPFFAGGAGLGACSHFSDTLLGGGPPLDPTAADAIITVAAEHGDAKLYDALAAAASHAASKEDRDRYLHALPHFRDPVLVGRALHDLRSSGIHRQDTGIYLAQFFDNPVARARAWAFVKQHWADLEPKLGIADGEATLVSALGAFCDAGARDDIKMFFAAHTLRTATRTLDETIGRIDTCIEMGRTQTPFLNEWLARRSLRGRI